MRTRAAMIWGHGEDWTVDEIDLDDPRKGEVMVALAATGLCHSDEHLRLGDMPAYGFPMIGGHEGAGVVEKVGPGVTSVREGDHVVLSFVPACGRCPSCSRGHQNLCDLGAHLLVGLQLDRTSRHHVRGGDARLMCLVGAFAGHTVCGEASVIRIDKDIPLELAALVGCAVTTGWGSAVYAAEVKPGDTVVVMGVGGVGTNAVQGARHAGAQHVIALDPAGFRRRQAPTFGATHVAASHSEAFELVRDLTHGRYANSTIITVGVPGRDTIRQAMALTGKAGTVVLTSMAPFTQTDLTLPMAELTTLEKSIRGSLFGSANPRYDVPKLLSLWRSGQLRLEELVTRSYKLDDINLGYEDMYRGDTIRGVLTFT
ncbi:NDMA-dependent alcohol dehydrogenase [Frankia sp. Cppng1_Ct_nod]|uniref:NDMA-dependent alcohol dehydrogenase n=1 Tax=Frankia sp. Cppng1_Ct_nod TaxID=2897162 RepID=UPI0010418BB6|nr:NDMA-dependent alcohol dehydrogenase [Frankia sp. Cppng1_Ct_nod]